MQQKLIRGLYDTIIPQCWRTNAVVKVNILNDRDMNGYIREGSDDHFANTEADDSIDGIYESGPPTITLRGSITNLSLPYTFAHEYGHYFWQSQLTAQDRKAYSEIYNREKKARHLVTEYAQDGVDEGFAEAFSFYVVSKVILSKKDASSTKFLDDVLSRSGKVQLSRS